MALAELARLQALSGELARQQQQQQTPARRRWGLRAAAEAPTPLPEAAVAASTAPLQAAAEVDAAAGVTPPGLQQQIAAAGAAAEAGPAAGAALAGSSVGQEETAAAAEQQQQQAAGRQQQQQQQQQQVQEEQEALPPRFTDAELIRFAMMHGLLRATTPAQHRAALREGAAAAARTAVWLREHPFSSDAELARFAHLIGWQVRGGAPTHGYNAPTWQPHPAAPPPRTHLPLPCPATAGHRRGGAPRAVCRDGEGGERVPRPRRAGLFKRHTDPHGAGGGAAAPWRAHHCRPSGCTKRRRRRRGGRRRGRRGPACGRRPVHSGARRPLPPRAAGGGDGLQRGVCAQRGAHFVGVQGRGRQPGAPLPRQARCAAVRCRAALCADAPGAPPGPAGNRPAHDRLRAPPTATALAGCTRWCFWTCRACWVGS